MSTNRYKKTTNPFEDDDDKKSRNPFNDYDDDVDDETFLRNSRRYNGEQNGRSFDDQLQTFHERKKAIEERTLNSTERSISILRDSEQVGIATAEELVRQREKLERTDKQLDEINATLRFSQKHINGIKSVFSSLKNYMSGKNEMTPPGVGSTSNATKQQTPSSSALSPEDSSKSSLRDTLSSYDRYDNHPATRLRGADYSNTPSQSQVSGSKDFSSKLDANLQEMCTNISKLKGLATDLSYEIDSQNDLISTITDKTETADITIKRQNKDMQRILKK